MFNKGKSRNYPKISNLSLEILGFIDESSSKKVLLT